MRNLFITSSVAALMLGIFAVVASAQNTTERVRFAKGATSASLTRTIPANGSIKFLVGARKGQSMSFTIGYDFKDSDVEGFLTEPGLQDISLTMQPKENYDLKVKKTGDHSLIVNNTTRKKITITLYLDIE